VCNYAIMMPYAAYLRIYEPLSAFVDPDRARWAAYATSAARSRRQAALAQEYAESLRRVAAVPPVLVPERESEHAYLRYLEGVTYVCPWQIRLRSWLALSELRATGDSQIGEVLAPNQVADAVAALPGEQAAGRVYIRTSAWSVPITWFVLFAPTDRRAADGAVSYSTMMSQSRQRLTRTIAVARGAIRQLPGSRGRLLEEALAVEAELAGLQRWLAEFHPYSLIELDYGGLVRLMSASALRTDESVAETSAAIEALARSEWEVALAMHQRVVARWRAPRATAGAN
jgi:hypothetical protein